jgi:SagB-type dehydrogenase family enzyme
VTLTLTPGIAYLPVAESPPNLEQVQWNSAPARYKMYDHAPRIDLSAVAPGIRTVLRETAGLSRQRFHAGSAGDLETNLDTWRAPSPEAPDLMRVVPSGGALYPYELYLFVHGDDTLRDGLYHHNPLGDSLEVLEAGGGGGRLMRALGTGALARYTLVATCCFSRNSFKYGDFGYRVQSVDLGVVVGQGCEAARRQGWKVRVRYGFDDGRLDELLGLDAEVEAAYAVLELGERCTLSSAAATRPTPARANSATPAGLERWPRLRALHASARLPTAAVTIESLPRPDPASEIPLPRLEERSVPLEAVWQRRSATHAFATRELSLVEASAVFQSATPYPDDTLVASHCTLYALVNHVQGLERGVYLYHPDSHSLELTRAGDQRAALSRTLGGPTQNAFAVSLGLFAVGNVRDGLERGGDRWYRVLNMDAGVVVARLYRASSGLGLACHANLNYQVRVANEALGLRAPWTTLVQVLIGGAAVNGRVLDLPLVTASGAAKGAGA